MNILIIPPNDLISNSLPNRLYYLARVWQSTHTLYLLRYPSYPTSANIERPLKRIDIVPKTKPSSNPGTYYIKNATFIYATLKNVFKRENIDIVVHANILPSMFAVDLAKRYKIKTIFDYLDHYPESASIYFRNKILKNIVRIAVSMITKYNLENSDKIVTVSYTLKHMIEKSTKRLVYLIPNGVDTELFRPLPKYSARRELQLDHYDPILLYYGSIAEWVDYDSLIELVSKLKPLYPRILLLLVGNIYRKDEEEYIKRKVKELNVEKNVTLSSSQPEERIPLYVSASDIVIAPYKMMQKNFVTPLKVIEALACERPIIVPDILEFRLWFGNYIEYYRNNEELLMKVSFILKNVDEYSNKLSEARKYVKDRFDWRRLAVEYEQLFYL